MKTAGERLGSSFSWLNATQFLGALNDNIFKLLIIAFIIHLQTAEAASKVSALALAVFVVPFLLFSALAGNLADRFSKRNIIVAAKACEAVVMIAGCIAFTAESMQALYIVLFMMATQSAFFGPSKYGIVPELVRTDQLSKANSFIEALTYMAIVTGTASVPVLLYLTGQRYGAAALACAAIAISGFITSLLIHPTPPAGGSKKASILFVADIWRTLRGIRHDKDLLLAVIGSAYFLMIAAFIHITVIPYGIERFGFDESQAGFLFLPAAVGIGLGAFWAGRLSGRNVEFGVVPLGALGLTLTSIALGIIRPDVYTGLTLILLMGVSAGLFIVPIHAFIQLRSPNQNRGQVLAASSFLGWVGVLAASGLVYFFNRFLSMASPQIFIVLGGITLALTVVTVILLPDFLIRFLCLTIVRFCYRIKTIGIDNIPDDQGVLFVCNHASLVDAPLLAATQSRPIRFLMDREIYNSSRLKPLFKLMKVIPISPNDPPKRIIHSLKKARAAIERGLAVCIFAEGAMTRNGMMLGFKGGFERITRAGKYKVIPTYIGGAWGSIFSYYHGKPLSTLPKKFPYPVSIHFGKPMPADSKAHQIRQKVAELSCDYYQDKKSRRISLGESFVRVARKNWRRHCISDSTGKKLNFGQALTAAIALKTKLGKITGQHEKIGILLPPSNAAALANAAVTMAGKVTVNLNYTGSRDLINSAIAQCGIKTIISSRKFIDKFENFKSLAGLVFIEDIKNDVNSNDKLTAYIKARLLPKQFLTGRRKFNGDCLATIIFSSGSSGKPKGVMLSHHNILSNIEALRTVFHLNPYDDICAVLPFFHSFGFTAALWLPLVCGISATFIANPLDGAYVGQTVREGESTILFGAPTFLLSYLRRAKPDDFATLRSVVVGAEKLQIRIADSFEVKFGIRPLEAYGMTELSPAVSLNLENTRSGGVFQVGNKPGTVGQPIPGVTVRIVNPETNEELGIGCDGLLMVKGPNIMLGYLNKKQQTDEVLKDGWYNTGDIARIDDDGFITITDRLSRFSKIAGEMVPHIAIEQAYLEALDTHEQLIAVTSVPNPKRGEELIVLHLEKAGNAEKLHEIISKSNLPNIWKPRPDNYIKIKEIPALGSGKLDIMTLRKIAQKAKNNNQTKE
ncbi:acyl-[ACP]--phospholipid O-acyltransferase [Planctomycetota bacterium]